MRLCSRTVQRTAIGSGTHLHSRHEHGGWQATVKQQWQMITPGAQDKMGPFCRCAADCALVYDALRGRDPADVASQDLPLGNPFAVNVSGLTLGVLPSAQDSSVEVRPRPQAAMPMSVAPLAACCNAPAACIRCPRCSGSGAHMADKVPSSR